MQTDNISLCSDLMNGTPSENYTKFSIETNKSQYVADGHSEESRRLLTLLRSTPKVRGNSRGIKRTNLRLTRDVSVANMAGDGNIILPLTLDLAVNVPVGTPATDVSELANQLADALSGSVDAPSDLFSDLANNREI